MPSPLPPNHAPSSTSGPDRAGRSQKRSPGVGHTMPVSRAASAGGGEVARAGAAGGTSWALGGATFAAAGSATTCARAGAGGGVSGAAGSTTRSPAPPPPLFTSSSRNARFSASSLAMRASASAMDAPPKPLPPRFGAAAAATGARGRGAARGRSAPARPKPAMGGVRGGECVWGGMRPAAAAVGPCGAALDPVFCFLAHTRSCLPRPPNPSCRPNPGAAVAPPAPPPPAPAGAAAGAATHRAPRRRPSPAIGRAVLVRSRPSNSVPGRVSEKWEAAAFGSRARFDAPSGVALAGSPPTHSTGC